MDVLTNRPFVPPTPTTTSADVTFFSNGENLGYYPTGNRLVAWPCQTRVGYSFATSGPYAGCCATHSSNAAPIATNCEDSYLTYNNGQSTFCESGCLRQTVHESYHHPDSGWTRHAYACSTQGIPATLYRSIKRPSPTCPPQLLSCSHKFLRRASDIWEETDTSGVAAWVWAVGALALSIGLISFLVRRKRRY